MKKIFLIAATLLSQLVVGQNKITPELLWKLGRVSEPQLSPDAKTVVYNVRTFDVAANKGQGDIYIVASVGGLAMKLAADPAQDETSARWRPDGKKVGFLSADKNGDNQLFEINTDGSARTQITSVKGGINMFGYATPMNYIWYAADVKLDKKPSEIYPDLPKTDGARIIDGLMYRHWNAWEDYAYSHVFVAAYTDGHPAGAATDIMQGERYDCPLQPFAGDEDISFSSDGKSIAYSCKKLNGTAYAMSTNSDVYIYDIAAKTTMNATEGMNGYDNAPVYSADGTKMLWLSMETAGYESDRNRLFIWDAATKSKKELLTAFDYSVDKALFSADGKMVYFLAGINGTHQLFSYDMNPKSKAPLRQITNDQADYNELQVGTLNKKAHIITSRTDMTNPAELYIVDAGTGVATALTSTNAATWGSIKKPKVEKRMIKTSDGKDMLTWVIYPPDFDKTKKYKTLLFCQGGPQSIVSQAFSYRWNFSLMAANDYIIVAPNRRGLPSFGEAWNDQIQGDWGGQAMTDLLSAIDDVSKETYVDKDRLGAIGASFGGYSVYWLAGHHNKRFKTFIAHCGVFNLESEYGATEEMFFANHDMEGPYWNTPEPKSYEKFSPHKFVKNWDTPILIIHNEKDFRVPLNQGMEAFTAAQLNNIPSRFLYFPDEGHWVTKPQNSILWQRVFFEWLNTTLK
ncbi:MAG: S9 family peptidase [Bacteroidota bacterium]